MLISIASNLLYFLLLYYLCAKVYDKKESKSLLVFLVLAIIKAFLPINGLLSILFYLVAILFFDRKRLVQNFALNSFLLVSFLCATFFGEGLTLVLTSLLTGLSTTTILATPNYMLLGNVISLLIQALLVSSIVSIFRLYKIVPNWYDCLMFAILPLGMMLLIISLKPMILYAPTINYLLAFSLLFFLLALCVILYVFSRILKNINYQHKYEMELQKQAQDQAYVQHFETNIEKLKIMKHDVEKHYRSLDQLLSTNQMEEAQKYIKTLYNETKTTTLGITGIKQIDMVLFSYQDLFVQHDIEVKYAIQPVDLSGIDPCYITIIFGNILDNAIESCIHAKQKQMKIVLALHEPYQILKVVNSCDQTLMDDGRYVSIKRNGKTSYGLDSIQRCAEKNHAHCSFQYDEEHHLFTSTVYFLKNEIDK